MTLPTPSATNPRPIHVPDEWCDHDLLTFEQFCTLIQIPVRTVRDWRRRGIGPRWTKLDGTGRLYLSVAETRRFLRATTAPHFVGSTGRQHEEKTA